MEVVRALNTHLEEGETALWVGSTAERTSGSLLRQILSQRGLDITAIDRFLGPQLDALSDPKSMRDLDFAAERVARAVVRGERIMIHGDYDADGVTSTALVVQFMRSIDACVDYFIPDRFRDGYGLNSKSLQVFSKRGITVVITVDCGISAFEQARSAKTLGIDLIITDHHRCSDELPEAFAVVNPRRSDCNFPYKGLCGAGVAFYFLIALRAELRRRGFFRNRKEPGLRSYLDLVFLGTLADAVPLTEDNRILSQFGFFALIAGARPGVGALLTAANINRRTVTARDLSFGVVPLVNAAGRIAHANRAVELFLSSDHHQAASLANELRAYNDQRRRIEADMLKEVESQLRSYDTSQPAIVLWGAQWHAGVLGIVAARIAERFGRPTLLLNVENGVAKGSGRGIDGVDLYHTVSALDDLLLSYGGHAQAVGVTLTALNTEKLKDRFCAEISRVGVGMPEGKSLISIDARLPLTKLTLELLEELRALEPYGVGNPEPIFRSGGARIVDRKRVGANGQSLKLTVLQADKILQAIAYRFGEVDIPLDKPVELAFTPQINAYRASPEVEIRLHDFRRVER